LLILSLATPQLTRNDGWRRDRGGGGVYELADVPALTILTDGVDNLMDEMFFGIEIED
jgi:hypothetical protein